jgi:hypothetical protein
MDSRQIKATRTRRDVSANRWYTATSICEVSDIGILETLIDNTKGTLSYEDNEGIVSHVRIAMAGLGRRRVQIANLPPEMPKTVMVTKMYVL